MHRLMLPLLKQSYTRMKLSPTSMSLAQGQAQGRMNGSGYAETKDHLSTIATSSGAGNNNKGVMMKKRKKKNHELAGGGGNTNSQEYVGGEEDNAGQSQSQPLPYSEDLDWGDFLFNLISMCIVYIYFSKAAVGGENHAAVGAVAIASVDITLLALRWLWYERQLSYGPTVVQLFSLYRVVILPLANTWMVWSLLSKLGIHQPGLGLVFFLLTVFVTVLGVGLTASRSLLTAPLQLSVVALASVSTPYVCRQGLGLNPLGLGCMGVVSLGQLGMGVVLPAVLVHIVDLSTVCMSVSKHGGDGEGANTARPTSQK